MDGADADFDVPSPKRMRVGERDGEIQNHDQGRPSQPETPIDDLDDLYGETSTDVPSPKKHSEGLITASGCLQQSVQKSPRFQLPGLGLSTYHNGSGDTSQEVAVVDTGLKKNDMTALRDNAQSIPTADAPPDCEPLNTTHSPLLQDSTAEKEERAGELQGIQDGLAANALSGHGDTGEYNTKHGLPESEPRATHELVTPPDVVMGESSAFQQAIIPRDDIQTSKELPADSCNDTETSLHPAPIESASLEPESGARQLVPESDQQMELTAILVEGKDAVTDSTKMDLEAEFEMDSSPIESSSDSSSDSSSSDDSDDYQMLSPEEQARRLMQEDGGSDGEGAQDIGAGTGQLRTTNEKPDEVVPKPNITITPEMRIQELGDVENLVENLVLIKAKTSGEYQVLESGSVLCLGDRSVIGVVSETLGRVEQPYYAVRFTNAASIAEAGISKGTSIFYSEKHSTTVFTQPLKAFKGSDASNIHDEEVADDEIEFSDDEAEAEYKKKMKQERQNRKDARPGVPDGFSKGPGGRGANRRRGRGNKDHRGGKSSDHQRNPNSGGMNYDDMETDEPYTPLARPSNLHEIMGRNEAPVESLNGRSAATKGSSDSGARDYGGGREGRGRGDRNRGSRGGRGDQRERGGHAMSSHDAHPGSHDQYRQSRSEYAPTQTDSPFNHFQGRYQPPIGSFSGQQQNEHQHAHMQNNSQSYGYNNSPINQPPHYPYHNSAPQNLTPNIPPGAFINPAFLAQAYQNPFAPQTALSQQFSPNGSMSFPAHSGGQQPPFPNPTDDSPAAQERMRLLRDLARNLAQSHRTD